MLAKDIPLHEKNCVNQFLKAQPLGDLGGTYSSFCKQRSPQKGFFQFLYRLKLPTKAAGSSSSLCFFLQHFSDSLVKAQSIVSSIPIMRKKRMPTSRATPMTERDKNVNQQLPKLYGYITLNILQAHFEIRGATVVLDTSFCCFQDKNLTFSVQSDFE